MQRPGAITAGATLCRSGNWLGAPLTQWLQPCCSVRSLATTSAIQSARAPRVAIRLEQDVSGGGGETDRRQSGDAKREPKLEVEHWRFFRANKRPPPV